MQCFTVILTGEKVMRMAKPEQVMLEVSTTCVILVGIRNDGAVLEKFDGSSKIEP